MWEVFFHIAHEQTLMLGGEHTNKFCLQLPSHVGLLLLGTSLRRVGGVGQGSRHKHTHTTFLDLQLFQT